MDVKSLITSDLVPAAPAPRPFEPLYDSEVVEKFTIPVTTTTTTTPPPGTNII
jgi:hypothetical protein